MDTKQKEDISYTAEYIVGAGYLLFFCLAFALCSVFYYFTYLRSYQLRPGPSAINPFATNLPPTTPTPHVSMDDQSKLKRIFEDDFNNDQNHWTLYNDEFKEEVRKGKLYFESRIEDNWAFAACESCPYLKKPFYLQADLTTATATDQSFGIIFNLNKTNNNFYLFQINTEAKRYYLYHLNFFGWSIREAGDSNFIRSFPASNTLGIYANQDTVEFYINGEIIDSYKESGFTFQSGYFSFYVDNSGFQLIVDNLIVNEVGKK